MTSPITGIAGQWLIASLAEFTNLCKEGCVPSFVRPILYGASLCALNKKDGGITPFAVGSTLRRLVARVASCQLVKELLAPAQLGFGIQVGDEAAAHLLLAASLIILPRVKLY